MGSPVFKTGGAAPGVARWVRLPCAPATPPLAVERRAAQIPAMRIRRLGAIAVLPVAVAGVLAGCSSLPLPVVAPPAATDPAGARQQAHAVLSRWADAVAAAGGHPAVTPVGELTGQVGDWEDAVGENNKPALLAGMVSSVVSVGDQRPPDGEVTWPEGTTTKVPLISAQEGVVGIGSTTAAPCHGCTDLSITDARLTTGPIQTTRGPATAPIWEYTLQGTAVKLTRVAIANAVSVAPTEADSALGLAIDAASGSVTGNELTVSFIGAPDHVDQPCGEDYTGEAVESDLAVTVIVTRHPHVGQVPVACPAVGFRRTATATLAAPLGDRAVLDFQTGTPVPLVVLP